MPQKYKSNYTKREFSVFDKVSSDGTKLFCSRGQDIYEDHAEDIYVEAKDKAAATRAIKDYMKTMYNGYDKSWEEKRIQNIHECKDVQVIVITHDKRRRKKKK